jgi:GxxExxY protein
MDSNESSEKSHPGSRDWVTSAIIGSAIEVHRELGPGLLESSYEACLAHELVIRGFKVIRQLAIPVSYKGISLDCGYRADLLVEEQIIVELKTVERIAPIHEAQILSYLRLSGKSVGLLINFHSYTIRQGLKRVVL